MSNLFEGQRVRLRAIEPEDWEAHYLWDQDTDMSRAVAFVWPPGSKVRAKKWAEEQAVRKGDDDALYLQIETLDGGHVGTLSTQNCDRRVGTFNYGVAIMDAHQRHGYASEAIRLILRYYFEELRYQKVTVEVYGFNAASIALHERLGFQLEGRLRRMVYTRGEFHDQVWFGMTAEEFAEKHGASF